MAKFCKCTWGNDSCISVQRQFSADAASGEQRLLKLEIKIRQHTVTWRRASLTPPTAHKLHSDDLLSRAIFRERSRCSASNTNKTIVILVCALLLCVCAAPEYLWPSVPNHEVHRRRQLTSLSETHSHAQLLLHISHCTADAHLHVIIDKFAFASRQIKLSERL